MDRYIAMASRKRRKLAHATQSTNYSSDTAKGTDELQGCSTAAEGGQSFLYKEVKGDLFKSPYDESLAHCISSDVRMGKGIAAIFKKRYGGVQELLAQKKKTGDVAVLKWEGRFIYYLITKDKFSDKPTYETLRQSLEAMRDHSVANKVSSISMPRIGCGLDGLTWDSVYVVLQRVFKDTGIAITIYSI